MSALKVLERNLSRTTVLTIPPSPSTGTRSGQREPEKYRGERQLSQFIVKDDGQSKIGQPVLDKNLMISPGGTPATEEQSKEKELVMISEGLPMSIQQSMEVNKDLLMTTMGTPITVEELLQRNLAGTRGSSGSYWDDNGEVGEDFLENELLMSTAGTPLTEQQFMERHGLQTTAGTPMTLEEFKQRNMQAGTPVMPVSADYGGEAKNAGGTEMRGKISKLKVRHSME